MKKKSQVIGGRYGVVEGKSPWPSPHRSKAPSSRYIYPSQIRKLTIRGRGGPSSCACKMGEKIARIESPGFMLCDALAFKSTILPLGIASNPKKV